MNLMKINHVNVLHHWESIELKTKQGHPQCGPRWMLKEIRNGPKHVWNVKNMASQVNYTYEVPILCWSS
jgi:hypothetical protein